MRFSSAFLPDSCILSHVLNPFLGPFGLSVMRNLHVVPGSCILAMLFSANFAGAQSTEYPSAQPSTPESVQSAAPQKVVDTGASDPKNDAALRDYSNYRQNSLTGFTGLMHTVAADSGAPGTFRVSYLFSAYSGSGFLCPTVAACGTRPAGVTDSQDSLSRIGQDLALSATLARFLEATVELHSHAVSDSFGDPSVTHVIGDTSLGMKAFTPRQPDQLFSVGGLGQLRLLGGSGEIGIQNANVAIGALGTLDFTNRKNPELRAPLRFHSNLGYLFDNSGSVATHTEQSRGVPITRIERFGQGINRVDSIFLGLGGEFVTSLFQPFAEWTMDITANRQGFTCHASNVSAGDGCLSHTNSIAGAPSRLTIGTRLTPPVRGLSAMLGFDIGTSGTSTFVEERAPELPWNFYLGIGYAIDTYVAPRPHLVVPPPTVVHVTRPTQYHLLGKVVDETSSQPIAHATIEFEALDSTGMLSRADGSFESGNMPPGEYKLSITADGYKSGTCTVRVEQKPNSENSDAEQPVVKNPAVECPLKPVPALGALHGTVIDAESTAKVANARIKVRDDRGRALEVQSDAAGLFAVANIPVGEAQIEVTAEGFLPKAAAATITKNSENHVTVSIHKVPKKPNVTVSPKELKLKGQVRFAGTTSTLDPDSRILLEEVAGTLLKHADLGNIEIQSFVDDSGNAAFDKRLTEERAQVVKVELESLGVESNRLKTVGLGSENPLAPNTNDANRAKNRRIKFTIVKPERLNR